MTSVIYSDDHGGTWNRGDVAGPNTETFVIPNEAVAVQLADGRVMLNMRSESKAHRRLIAYSWDGATRWTPPFFHEQLLEPICMASMVRLSRTTTHKRNRLLFSNPDSLDPRNANTAAEPGQGRARKNLSVKLSYDEGESWPISQTIEPGPSGYSDLAVTPDGTILCFYERGSSDGKAGDSRPSLALARFNLEWLTDGRDALNRRD
jgi:sialidase-1